MAVDVELFTTDHVIRGFIETAGERLSDVLNVKNEQALVLRDVQVVRLLSIGKTPPVLLPKAHVEKSSILFGLPIEQDLTHKSLYRRASRQEYDIFILLPGFEIKGTIHLTERMDIRRGLTTRPEDFIPLTDAIATYVLYPQVATRPGTIVFNKAAVTLLGEPRQRLSEQRIPEE
jgi:hypothetical protein